MFTSWLGLLWQWFLPGLTSLDPNAAALLLADASGSPSADSTDPQRDADAAQVIRATFQQAAAPR